MVRLNGFFVSRVLYGMRSRGFRITRFFFYSIGFFTCGTVRYAYCIGQDWCCTVPYCTIRSSTRGTYSSCYSNWR